VQRQISLHFVRQLGWLKTSIASSPPVNALIIFLRNANRSGSAAKFGAVEYAVVTDKVNN
jgi:hypothetical protein